MLATGAGELKPFTKNVRNMKKAVDDMEVPRVCCVSHTSAAVHEGLLSQCSITDSPVNTRKVVGQCCNSIFRIRKSHIKVYNLFQQNKKKWDIPSSWS